MDRIPKVKEARPARHVRQQRGEKRKKEIPSKRANSNRHHDAVAVRSNPNRAAEAYFCSVAERGASELHGWVRLFCRPRSKNPRSSGATKQAAPLAGAAERE